jgi:hypothetical protein
MTVVTASSVGTAGSLRRQADHRISGGSSRHVATGRPRPRATTARRSPRQNECIDDSAERSVVKSCAATVVGMDDAAMSDGPS